MNYRNYTELEPLVQPMYYAYPKRNAAYEVKNQFMFGSELMVAPITKPCSKQSGLGSTEVWFPKGDWFDFFSGLHYTSNNGRKLHVCRSLHEYPVFAKAGAIVPMQTSKELVAGNELEIVVFPGASNNFTLYEDGGDGSEFEKGSYVQTELQLAWSENPTFVIKPAVGDVSLLPEKRKYRLIFRGYHASVVAKVYVNGVKQKVDCVYDAATHALCLDVEASCDSEIKVELLGEMLVTDNGDELERCVDLIQKMQLPYKQKDYLYEILSSNDSNLKITYESGLSKKLAYVYRHASMDADHADVIYALQEQLLLIDTGW
jgi:hypothetical protein